MRVLAPNDLMVPCLAHKTEGKLMFFLCKACLSDGHVQHKACNHDHRERSWIHTYTLIDMSHTMKLGYVVLEYKEIWHYLKGGRRLFRDFILNIVCRKTEYSGFPISCHTLEQRESHVHELNEKCGIDTSLEAIKNDPAGCYLNKIMTNSVWGKWTQNPSSQQELKMCSMIREYHECLFTGQVKCVTLVSDGLLQVEMKRNRNIDGEN